MMRVVVMPRWFRVVFLGVLVVFACLGPWVNTAKVSAGSGPDLGSRFVQTPPTLDGVLSPGEWGSPFCMVLSGFNDSTKTRAAELYLVNSATDLYVGIFLSEPNASSGDRLDLNFDPDHDHNATTGGEDTLRYTTIAPWICSGRGATGLRTLRSMAPRSALP